MALDSKVNPKVAALLKRVGRVATIERYSTEYDFKSNSRPAAPELSVQATITPILEKRRSLADDMTDASSYCFMAAEGAPIVPTTACFLIVDGKRWKIVEVVTHSAGTTPAAYEMRLANV